MIALLRGRPLHRQPDHCIVDVGGVGYEIFATNRGMDGWFQRGDDEVEVHVVTHVREDAITLFGFDDPAERVVFRQLMTVSGVGPKVALATLEAFSVPELARAIETSDIRALNRISGVGKKTAQRIALDLKGKIVPGLRIPEGGVARRPQAHQADTLALALERLGYSKAEVAKAKATLDEQGVDPEAPVAERLRAALKSLYGS